MNYSAYSSRMGWDRPMLLYTFYFPNPSLAGLQSLKTFDSIDLLKPRKKQNSYVFLPLLRYSLLPTLPRHIQR